MTSSRLPKVAGIQSSVSSNPSPAAAASTAAASTAAPGPAVPASSAACAADSSARATALGPGGSPADRDRIGDLSSLHDLTIRLVRTTSLDSALRETLRAGATLLGAPRGMVALAPGTDPGSEPSDSPERATERTIGLGLGRADLGQIETVPRFSATYARVLDAETDRSRTTGPDAGRGHTAGPDTRPADETDGTHAADGASRPHQPGRGPDHETGHEPAPGEAGASASEAESVPDPGAGLAHPALICPDIAADQALSPRHREVAARLGYAATYGVPLTTGSGTRLGAAVWFFDEPGEPTVRRRELLDSYLRHATEHCARLGECARTRADMVTLREELLPSALPRVPGVSLAVRHRTGPRGGGDWYDALPLPERAVGLAVGGVTGSGPAAVAAMGRLRASLRAYAVMEGEDPVAVLSDLELLLRLTEPSCSATALFAYAEPASRKILLAGAGHCAPLIVGPRRIEPVETAVSAPLGMLACWEAPSAEVVLREGETLLCYTDGLLHRTGHSMDRAFARLRSAAASAPRTAREDPDALVDHVLRTVLPGPLADLPDHPEDVVLLAARF
ncbi:PP2C family protein-serine/threonine phosphatase [Streptomyces sp. WMMB303]|uniref:PP2C family protein-serine/threonine phosphatase n=1 Tax=Streptomyces sp. WMMB303 TaxID=3034154 RepID=UPI0023EC280A|nr:PP2C family protein-serine/threonine phosphatase [Streptomyces sp. WMMB303]MDF4251616.1 PP2C family protein-serine/threonine phosphatase [Streptomyces sp. WMMB303]